ncbi:MAG: SPASM domain-containing protein, partial [Spirochaetota bacterium]|nr:SPASM domain-containing protein [Spirochaetota bacterium]
YLKSYLKTYKFFLEPDGNVSLCDRQSIGNINEQSIDDMTRSSQYRNSVKDFENCRGCWMGCFVEPSLRLNPFNGKLINRLYEMIKNEIDKSDSKLFSLNNFETKLSEKTCVNLDKLTSESIKISNKLH